MARREYTAGSPTTLASAFNSGATTFTITSDTNWPTSADYDFFVTIDGGTAQEERVLCSARTGTTVTVAASGRGKDGTGEKNHAAGASVWPSWSAQDADEANAHIESSGYASFSKSIHGLGSGDGVVVGTDKAQTLTAKTLTTPKINEAVNLTATSTELNILDGATLSTAELNVLDGVTASTAELNYVDGVTSAIQTQLNTKSPITDPSFLGTVSLPSTTSIGTVSSTEISYIDGVTSAIQTQINTALEAIVPKATVVSFAGATAPSGWLLCAGQAVSKTTYAGLYTALGANAYGTDTLTDFYLPDLRGRVPAGVDNMGGTDATRLDWANTLGTSGGAQTHTLTTAEIPQHTHTWSYYDAVSNTNDGGRSGARWDNSNDNEENIVNITTNGGTGGGGTHNNMQPTLLLNYIIKT